MASPALQPMCCWFVNNTDVQTNDSWNTTPLYTATIYDWKTMVISYSTLCILASCLSICGAICQLFPRKPSTIPRTEKEMESFIKQNRIVCWLALADFLASFGILIRSAVWLAGHLPWVPFSHGHRDAQMDVPHIFCALTSAWIQFFYICTYCWTLCYAIHMYRAAHDQRSSMEMYHIIGWVVPSVFSAAGLAFLYIPNPTSCEHTKLSLVPNYLASYVPILTVMIVNPILYYWVSRTVQQQLRGRGLYTDQERMAVDSLRHRFLSIMIVFYVCWSPNILNSILLVWLDSIDIGILIAVWHFMAIVNPLQALLNSLVYRNVGGCNIRWTRASLSQQVIYGWRYKKQRPDIQHMSQSQTDFDESIETSPLLHFRR